MALSAPVLRGGPALHLVTTQGRNFLPCCEGQDRGGRGPSGFTQAALLTWPVSRCVSHTKSEARSRFLVTHLPSSSVRDTLLFHRSEKSTVWVEAQTQIRSGHRQGPWELAAVI